MAFIGAKLALGIELNDIKNSTTEKTTACFEPSLDYIVSKIPRWDLDRFQYTPKEIGTCMKSVGEVMAIGRSFEESIQKALRMTHPSVIGFSAAGENIEPVSIKEELDASLVTPSNTRVKAIAKAFKSGYSVEKIAELTKIDPWFLNKLEDIYKIEKDITAGKTL